jgi:hypothetical protein
MAENTQTLSFAGDVTVQKCSVISSAGVEFSVKGQLIGLQIFEDLYSPFISGTVIFRDSLDFVNALPFVGQETLSLIVYTPSLERNGGKIEGQFYIHKMKDREYDGDRSVVYEMSFISKEFLNDVNVKMSRGYQGKVSEIAREVLTDKSAAFDTVKKLNIEESKNSIKYVSNYWSPVRNMNYLADRALNKTGSPSYVFFENRDGFNFGSLDLLMSSDNKPVQKFNYSNSTRNISNSGSANRDFNHDYKKISTFSVTDGFNTMERLRNGMIASRLHSYDLTSKQIDIRNFDIFNNFKEKKHLNAFPTVSTNLPAYYTSKMLLVPKSTMQFTGFDDVSNIKFLQRRISELNQANDFKLTITVPGRLDYTVGQTVVIQSFQVEPIKDRDTLSEISDKIFSGRYLVSAINHFITQKSHECTIELIKDSYIKDVFKGGN